jgi:hypothetical protein
LERRLIVKAETIIAAARALLKKALRHQGKGRGVKNVKYSGLTRRNPAGVR